jgi:thioredoxin reductase
MATRSHIDTDTLLTHRVRDYVIVGAGPGGLQLAYFLDRAGLDYIVLESQRTGHFFSVFPRHRRLISNNKVHTGFTDRDKNLRWDWNSLLTDGLTQLFTSYTGDYFPPADVLVTYLRDFRDRFGLNVLEQAHVVSVDRDSGGTFAVRLAGGRQLRARRVIIATGHTVPHTPAVPGIELGEQYAEISTDPSDYVNQRVLIVGKGNSGMETAENLFPVAASVHCLSPHPVRLAWTTHHVSDIRAVYHNTLDSYQLKMQNTVLDGTLVRIEPLPGGRRRVFFRYSHAKGQAWDLVVDRVLLCCGFRFDFGIFGPGCRLETCHDGRWPAMTSSWESVSVPGLYFAGTLMQARDYKQSFSGFIHGFRYCIRLLSEILLERYHGRPRPGEPIGASAAALTSRIIDRASNASSIFQLPALLADVYLLDEPGGQILCHRDTTTHYALDYRPWADRAVLVVTMEYGHLPPGSDPFNFPRDPEDGTTSQFIHPVLRLYAGRQLTDTYHVPEDLENEWDKPQYTKPALDAVTRMLARVRKAGQPVT